MFDLEGMIRLSFVTKAQNTLRLFVFALRLFETTYPTRQKVSSAANAKYSTKLNETAHTLSTTKHARRAYTIYGHSKKDWQVNMIPMSVATCVN